MSETTSGTEEKTDKGDKKNQARSKPPFKLNFVLRQELGRSYIAPAKPKEKVSIITSKFYSIHETRETDSATLEHVKDIEEAYRTGPKEKYREPLLESHRYGWFIEPLIDIDKRDRRLHFAIVSSDMVKIQSLLSQEKKYTSL